MGHTIQGAAAFALKERADSSSTIAEAAAIFQDAFLCGMPAAAQHALSVLQGLSVILQVNRGLDPKQYVKWHPGGTLGHLRDDEK